jgi:hypothetical protein
MKTFISNKGLEYALTLKDGYFNWERVERPTTVLKLRNNRTISIFSAKN